MDSFNTPSRPIPQFYHNNHSFTTKKARNTSTPSCKKVPPKPPSKSVPPVSRLFAQPKVNKAQPISFKDNGDSSLSRCYDETREEPYFNQCFQIECKLGSGSFGDVFKVKSKEDGKYYAIKKSRERFKGKSDRERKLEEVCKHEQLPKHPNCVRLYNAWEERQHLYIQTELCDKSLSDFAEENHDIPENIIWNILIDLLKAVHHLHEHDLIHLDIKPENIFIANDGTFKLGDFGLVLDLNKNDTNEATEGDPKYLAKELMQGIFTKSADIFSLGITILELACDLDLPSGADGWHQLRNGQIPDEILNRISIELKKIIIMMMHPNHQKRPSASQLLQHPYISKLAKQRIRELRMRKVGVVIKKLFALFISLFVKVFFFMSNTVRNFCRRIVRQPNQQSTPPHKTFSRNYNGDWDINYSDDEVFENSSSSHSQSNSRGSDLSFSFADSKFNCHNNHSDSPRPFTSTTAVQRHRSIFDPLSSPTFKTSSPIVNNHIYNDHSPTHLPLNRSKLSSQKLNFCDFDEEENFEWDKSVSLASIGPKNLLSTFDEIEKEESDEI